MSDKPGELNIKSASIMKDVVLEVNITGMKILKLRVAIAKFFLLCAAWVLGCGLEFKE